MYSAFVQKYFIVSAISLHRLKNGKQSKFFVRAIVHVRSIPATNKNSIARITKKKKKRIIKEEKKKCWYYLPHRLQPSSNTAEPIRLSCLDCASKTHPWQFSRIRTPFECFYSRNILSTTSNQLEIGKLIRLSCVSLSRHTTYRVKTLNEI